MTIPDSIRIYLPPALHPEWTAQYPDDLLREWAAAALGAKRCADDYLKALRIVLGNMARADRKGVCLLLRQQVPTVRHDEPCISRQTMRTLLPQLEGAGLVTRRGNRYVYRGRQRNAPAPDAEAEDLYSQIQREAEDAAHRRYCASLGLCPGEVPY